ncbi:MAG TPA: transglycosylase SLT domain-containing protein, partial [Thermoanaerobaculia bacterium]|nr:transglycosylase SLT domain-containing protein [Thermoanaerobaculia bacterium]
MRRRWVLIAIAIPLVGAFIGAIIYYARRPATTQPALPAKPEAPPDLEKLRDSFAAGVDAVQHKDGAGAVRYLSSFRFGPRAVEEYRLYYLGSGYQLTGNMVAARRTFAQLWHRTPRLIYRDEAGLNLAAMHAALGSSRQAADVCAALAIRTDNPSVAAAARWREIEQRLANGDVEAAMHAARRIVIASPRAGQVDDAIALLRAIWSLAPKDALHLTPEERLERAVCLLRDGDPQHAFDELTALAPSAPESLRLPVVLNRGLALYQLRRYSDAIHVLEPLTASAYKFAVPALYHLSKSYRAVANSIDPTVYKTITEKKKVSVKVRVGKGKAAKTVTRPRIVTTKKTVKLIDLAKKATKENYDRLATERLKDLLQLPLARPVRVEVLSTLIVIAESKNQDQYEQQLVRNLIRIDPFSDPGLQHFWDRAWTAYARGDLQTAKAIFRFIGDTYGNPNVKRQADYWYARAVDRQGQKEEAHAVYQRLASAPYLDLYAMHSVSRGAARQENRTNPLMKSGPDWREIAEKDMPSELRLAYELTALTDMRDARLEIQKNTTSENDRFSQALLADLYNSAGSPVLMQRAAKRAFPQIATAEQDSAPAYFLKMYYPVKYENAIRKYSTRNGLDPFLVMGLILQESAFIPNAKSAVGATGLMQLMPATAKELARRLSVPFGPARLENPEVNIQLGTAHLKMLVNLFGGNALLAVASYNAGQGNVLNWRRSARARPMDELIESIPYAETRN